MKVRTMFSLGFALACSLVLGTSPAKAATGVVISDELNVRESMSTSSDIVGTLSYGDDVLITYGPEDGWCEIYYEGDCYYVASPFVSIDGYVDDGDYDYDDDDYYDDDDDYEDFDDDDYYDDEDDYDEESSSRSGGTYLGSFTLTGYCNCAQCCGTAGNLTASGTWPTSGHTVAMGGVPFGTRLLINGQVYTVEDRGTPYGHVDIYFDSHSEALSFGLQYADVYQLD